MEKRLQKIADDIKVRFGLDAYEIATHSIHKERNSLGEAYYKFNMEFFPNEISWGAMKKIKSRRNSDC